MCSPFCHMYPPAHIRETLSGHLDLGVCHLVLRVEWNAPAWSDFRESASLFVHGPLPATSLFISATTAHWRLCGQLKPPDASPHLNCEVSDRPDMRLIREYVNDSVVSNRCINTLHPGTWLHQMSFE